MTIDTTPPGQPWRQLDLDRGWPPTWEREHDGWWYELSLLPAHTHLGEFPWRLRRMVTRARVDATQNLGRHPSVQAAERAIT